MHYQAIYVDQRKRTARFFCPIPMLKTFLRLLLLSDLPLLPLRLVHLISPRSDARDAQVAVELLHRVQERAIVVRQKDARRVFRVHAEAFRDRDRRRLWLNGRQAGGHDCTSGGRAKQGATKKKRVLEARRPRNRQKCHRHFVQTFIGG